MEILPGSVVIATLNPHYVLADYARSLGNLMLHRGRSPIVGSISKTTARSYHGRNECIKDFLASPGEFLLWADSDASFDVATFDTMYAAAHQLVAAPARFDQEEMIVPKITTALAFVYSVVSTEMKPNIFAWNTEDEDYDLVDIYEKDTQFWVDATGVHFTLIHRDVFETIGFPWHQDWIEHPDTGAPMGHDVSFFRQAQKAGFHVRYCADAKTGHTKPITVNEAMYEASLALEGKTLK